VSIPRHSGKPEPGSPSPDAAPWPNEPAPEPGRSRKPAESLPAGWEIVTLGGPIREGSFPAEFRRAIVRDPEGTEFSAILRRTKPDTSGVIVWIGEIKLTGRYLAYEITPGRILKRPDRQSYSIVETVNSAGIPRRAVVAAMDLKQPASKAYYLDALGITYSGRVSYVGEFIRMEAQNWDRPDDLMIQGQGPLFLRDGEIIPNRLLDHSLVFVTKSGTFGTDGQYRNIAADLTDIPDSYAYYDLTPRGEITDTEIRAGCELFRLAYDESLRYPQIPAAFLGQLFTGALATIDPRYFTAIMQAGVKGSGKTRYANRFDAIQARDSERTRDLRLIKSVLNAGDTTGTVKGPKYRIAHFGGYSVTVDDVLKDGNSPAQIMFGSDNVSNLLRSYDNGGAALAGVDHGRDKVVGRESPALHSSIRVLSEIRITGGSTLDRMLVMPDLTESWGKGNLFNIEIAERLSEPAALGSMHRAYSAYVHWIFQRIDTGAADAYDKARAETERWNVDSRYAERYAAAVAGHYLFRQYCETIGLDFSAQVNAAVTALRDNAEIQARTSVPLWQQWTADLRRVIMQTRVSFPGRPPLDPDGTPSATYGLPWIMGEPTLTESGEKIPRRILPVRVEDLGLIMTGGNPVPGPRSMIAGFIVPPREGKGGPKGSDYSRQWVIACRPGRFAELCNEVGKVSGRAYDPASVIDSLRAAGLGDRTKVLMQDGKGAKQERAYVFLASLLTEPEGN
jgi:hypothetical protein